MQRALLPQQRKGNRIQNVVVNDQDVSNRLCECAFDEDVLRYLLMAKQLGCQPERKTGSGWIFTSEVFKTSDGGAIRKVANSLIIERLPLGVSIHTGN